MFLHSPFSIRGASAEQIAAVLSGLLDIRYFWPSNIIFGHPVTLLRQLSQRSDSCFDNCHTETTAVLIVWQSAAYRFAVRTIWEERVYRE
jgi:hypothetical protein